jgi:ketosteroid isomerase-like protein
MFDRAEVEAAVAAKNAAQSRSFSAMAEFFTDDAVLVDSGAGRFEGRAALEKFLATSDALTRGWSMPVEWVAIDGNRVTVKLAMRLPGRRADGSYRDVPAVSLLVYAGAGRFSSQEDFYSSSKLAELLHEDP